MEKMKIGSRQFMIMVAIFAIGTTILVGPAVVASKARHDAWIASLLSIVTGLLIIWLYTYIIGLYPRKNIFEINDTILGKWLGTIASVFVIFMCIISLSQVIWSIGNFW